jgi:hypothetical protein
MAAMIQEVLASDQCGYVVEIAENLFWTCGPTVAEIGVDRSRSLINGAA